MRYLLMIHADESGWEAMSDDEREARLAQYTAFARRVRERGILHGGDELQSTASATTVRVQNGETLVTDGPYAETREALGGFFLVEVDSMDEAVDLATQLPEPPAGGGIEIRPVYVDEGGES
jgi:hypothetical protein